MSSLFSYVKTQLSIIDVINESVPLKPAGHYLKASCPFHNEKDASFTVSPDKQIFYCFGCHASGDVIGFIAKKENMTQLEAAQLLIEHYKITIPEKLLHGFNVLPAQDKAEKDNYYKVCETVSIVLHEYLLRHEQTQKYLADRNITTQSIKHFKIGYFPSGSHGTSALLKDLQHKGIMLKDLIDAGIVSEGRVTIFSPFEERIIFPIKDGFGHTCGFGGRVFRDGDDRPKYYNSKEAVGFEKGKLLFGFDLAKKSLTQHQVGFLVEGYLDCIMMVQSGYQNTVATLGTACTLEHLKMLARSIDTLFVLYDGDSAGQKAMLKLTELCWEVNLDLKVIVLPHGHDPASYLSQTNTLNELLSTATDIITFFINSTGNNFNSKPLAQKLRVAEKITALIAKVSSSFKQDLLLHHAASITQLSFSSLKDLMRTNNRQPQESFQSEIENNQSTNSKNPFTEGNDEVFLLEEKIFSAILYGVQTSIVLQVPSDIRNYFSPQIQYLLQQLDHFLLQNGAQSLSLHQFLDILDEENKQWVMRMSIKHNNHGCNTAFEHLLGRFYKHHWQKIVKDIKDQILKAKQENDNNKVQCVLERFSQLKHEILQQSRGLIR